MPLGNESHNNTFVMLVEDIQELKENQKTREET